MPDQMKPRPGQSGHQRRFAFELLDVVFAELAQAQGVCFLNGFRREDLGDRKQQNLRRIPPDAPGRTLDARPHRRQSLRQPFHRCFHAPVSHGTRAATLPRKRLWGSP